MTKKQQSLMRLAIAIQERAVDRQHPLPAVPLPFDAWGRCETLMRRIHLAEQRGFGLAARRLKSHLRDAVGRLAVEVRGYQLHLDAEAAAIRSATVQDIYADLLAMHEEFTEVSFDRRGQTISVTTESIELEGVYLGPFEIRLDWSALVDGHPHNYRVIAVEPNSAATNDEVTHPHVQDESVCEGEGRQPIRSALAEGRLLDFFTIVANLLRTYNSSSPFVSLSQWYGVDCADCGSTVCEDDRWSCEKCGTAVCGDCYFNCPGCDCCFCSECVTRCEGCDEHHCGTCMKECSCCDAELCQGCLDNQERCTACHDQKTEAENEESIEVTEAIATGDAHPQVHAGRLGEATVPA